MRSRAALRPVSRAAARDAASPPLAPGSRLAATSPRLADLLRSPEPGGRAVAAAAALHHQRENRPLMAGWDTKGAGGTTIDATDRLRAALRRLGKALRGLLGSGPRTP